MSKIFIEMIKKDIDDALQTQHITFEQVHYMIRQNIEKILLYGKNIEEKRFEETIQRFYDKEQELMTKLKELGDEINNIKKQLASNDEKMYEAIKKL
jgi:predicted RNase H-like nuclease (RuvC/YqgF family)